MFAPSSGTPAGRERELVELGPSEMLDESAFRGARDGVFRLGTAVKQYASLAERLGGRKDTESLRKKLQDEVAAITTLSRDTFTQIFELNKARQSDARAQQVEALTRTYKDTLARFKDVSAECEDRSRRFTPKPDAPKSGAQFMPNSTETSETDPEAPAAQQQAQQQLEYELDYNESLIAERDQGIQEIHQSILEVGDMMQDVAALVSDQGEQLNTVEDGITRVARDVERGVGALRAAERKQRACTRRLGCAFITIFVLVSATVLMIVHMVLG